ncbi:hypothetical protein TNCV_1439201 [Trichonephila clavipes]|nr:hypothetical protein TNCV_1439201 [Trichonephila clavipes]
MNNGNGYINLLSDVSPSALRKSPNIYGALLGRRRYTLSSSGMLSKLEMNIWALRLLTIIPSRPTTSDEHFWLILQTIEPHLSESNNRRSSRNTVTSRKLTSGALWAGGILVCTSSKTMKRHDARANNGDR